MIYYKHKNSEVFAYSIADIQKAESIAQLENDLSAARQNLANIAPPAQGEAPGAEYTAAQQAVSFAQAAMDAVPPLFSSIRDNIAQCDLMTEAQVQAHINPPQSLASLAAAAQRKVDTEYTRRMGELANNYPAHERESWPMQLAEAQELQADENAATPWIDQCAAARGLDRLELATRILQKDATYRHVSGSLTGIRQWHEDRIAALLDAGEASRQALDAYDTTQGWPSADLREPQPA